MYKVVCIEIGYDEQNPYHNSEDKEECEIVCKIVSEKYQSRCFVYENDKRIIMIDHSGYNKFEK